MENPNSATQTVVSEDVEIVGTIKAANGLRFDGKLNGDLNCNADVILGKTGSVKGNINVNSITVHGQLNGNITAKDRIELKATARIAGDVKAKRMTVEDGVTFVGKAEVNPSGVSVSKPQTPFELQPPGADNGDARPAAEAQGSADKAGDRGRGIPFIGKK